jgi:formylglycine-generating enzyme required for sulfatase activity
VTVSTFQIQEQAVSLKDYLLYLKLSSRELPDVLKGLNGGDPDADMVGLTFGEASDYCRFFGQTLPTEAEFELAFFHSDSLRQKHNELYEWTLDFFREELPFQLRSRDPVVKTPGYQKTVRDKKLRQRKAQALQFRSATTAFRCVTHLQPMHKKEILLDHTQVRPNASGTVSHFYSIKTKPSQALVYRDPTFHHLVGQTPFFGFFEGEGVAFTIIKEGYMPEVLHLNTPPNRGQQISLELRPVPSEQYEHRVREAVMQLVSGGRVRVGLSEREFVQIKNKIVSLRNNRDLTDEQIRRYILDERPDRIVYVRDFYMDETEVTNGQYEKYMQASGASRPRCDYSDPEQPVSCVNWLEAYQFCAFYGLNLPTEVQFDKAAKGAEERLRAVWISDKKQSVGSHKGDLSRYGIKDLAGNVSEWSRDWYDPDLYQRFMMTAPRATSIHKELKSVRGPSFASHRLDNRLQKRRAMNPQAFANDVGFRCVQEL